MRNGRRYEITEAETVAGPGAPGAPVRFPVPPSSSSRAPTSRPPELFPPGDSRDLLVAGFDTAVSAPAGWTAVDTVTLDPNRRGVIRNVDFQVSGTITDTSRISWRITVDGGPVEGWMVELFPRSAAFVGQNYEAESTLIRLTPGAVVALEYLVTAGGPFVIGGALRGWTWGT